MSASVIGGRLAALSKPYVMRTCLLALSLLLTFTLAYGKGYGRYDPQRLLTISETPSGKRYGVDEAYLDRMLNDLALHAKNYPPRFDTPQDRQRAIRDVRILSGMFDILISGPAANTGLLARAGLLNSIGYNLNIAGSAEKTTAIFQRLLAAAPSDPQGNYRYGMFLAEAGKPKEALPFLEKALAAGVTNAAYTLGMTYLALGDKQNALNNLEIYSQHRPSDGNAARIIDAIRNGKVKIKHSH